MGAPGGGGGEAIGQPGILRRAQQLAFRVGPCAIAEGAKRSHRRLRITFARQHLFKTELLLAPLQPGVEPEQSCQIADLIGGIGRVRHRHPFTVGLLGRRLAHLPVTFGLRLVVLRAVHVTVVRAFVVVPHRDHRQHLMQALAIGIGAVGGVTQAVIGQRDDFGLWGQHALGHALPRIGVIVGAIFVDVVAQMHREIGVVRLGRVAIGIEPAEPEVGTREHRQPELCGGVHRQGAGAARGRGRAARRDEAVKIPAVRRKAGGDPLGAPVALRAGGYAAFSDGLGEILALAHLPGQRGIRLGDIARPQQHTAGRRLPAGDIVGEAAAKAARSKRSGCQRGASPGEREQGAAGQCRG